MSLNIIKWGGTTNTTSAPGRTISYIAIHYTAGVSSKKGSARSMCSWCANPSAQASADFAVDDEEIVQYNADPRNRYCWAVGGGKMNGKGGSLYGVAKNANVISIEMCSNNSTGKITYPNDPHYSLTDATINNAVLLTQYLMKEYNIDVDHVIRHFDVNSKDCPGVIGWNADSGDESKWKEFKQRIGGEYKEPELYRVRISWDKPDTQLGAYSVYENGVANCPEGYHLYNNKGECVYTPPEKSVEELTCKDLSGSEAQRIARVAPIYQEAMKRTGMLASVGLAQFALESFYGQTDLAINANNCHGMKCSLSGNTWANSVWDGKSKYGKYSPEVYDGVTHSVYSEFRAYPCILKSVEDRCAYFIGAWLNSAKTKKRYPGINMIKDSTEQAKLIKAGAYATDPDYVKKLTNIISRFNLTQYDQGIYPDVWNGGTVDPTPTPEPQPPVTKDRYKVGSDYANGVVVNQVGAFSILENAKNIAMARHLNVYDSEDNYKCICSFPAPADGQYQVCAGRFSVKKNAERLAEKLHAKGFQAILVTEGKEWIVQCGLFSVQANADKMCTNIKRAGFDCLVRKI